MGLVPNLVDEGLSILQYVDDTILLMENDLEEAKNLRLLLMAFKKLAGLKINFHKSELFCFGLAKERSKEFSELFGCNQGTLPFKYLGIPMHFRRLLKKDWAHIYKRAFSKEA